MIPLLLTLLLPSGENFKFSNETQELRKYLPKTEDPSLLNVYKKHLIFYNEKHVPRVFQFKEGVVDVYSNISGKAVELGGYEPFGNGNREFPWGFPGGTHRSKIGKFRFVHLPEPVRHWSEWMYKNSSPNWHWTKRWVYPEGTIFGEVLLNQGHVFDVRIRKKVDGKWHSNAYRPVLTRDEYNEFLGIEGSNVTIKTLKNDHPTTVFNEKAAIDSLESIPKERVVELLNKPFRSAKGIPWITHKGVSGFAPTTDSDFHIVPKNYDGGFISVDNKSCMKCHEDVKKEVGEFDSPRDWYGLISGDDNIFSFHPFDPDYIYKSAAPNVARFNRKLIDANLLKHWND